VETLTYPRASESFSKDMGKCLMPLHGEVPYIVPSLRPQITASNRANRIRPMDPAHRDGPTGSASREEPRIPNPTVIPPELLSGFHFTFLIRHPRRSIPSLYEFPTPPKCFMTGWHGFKAEDAGYREMRRLFDYLTRIGQIGSNSNNEICIVDAEDLLAYPEEIVEKFCASVGIPFDRGMLRWDTEKDQQRAQDALNNWAPFHDAVLKSTSLK
jgi:Sulfotransferase domain